MVKISRNATTAKGDAVMSINFILPGMYEHYNLNFRLLELLEKHPEYFRDEVKVSACYGNFQFCIFDGGRNFYNYRHTCREEIEEVVKIYNDIYHVPVRLIFTNTQLKPEHYTDRFGNLVLSICENDMNEITVSDDNFEAWIKERYPQFHFISSTTKCLNKPEELVTELQKEDYTMVCLDYNLNKNMKLLESFTPEVKSKCEFLCNAICPPGCPQRKEHYKYNSLYSLSYGKGYQMENCQIRSNTVAPSTCSYHNNISPDELYNTYVPMGFNLFKLEGRTLGEVEVALNYARYMAKPEYANLVVTMLIENNESQKLFNNSVIKYYREVQK